MNKLIMMLTIQVTLIRNLWIMCHTVAWWTQERCNLLDNIRYIFMIPAIQVELNFIMIILSYG